MTFPSDKQFVTAWEDGLKLAQEKMMSVGICPATTDQSEDNWFYHPHVLTGSNERELNQQMYGDGDEDVNNSNGDQNVEESTSLPDVLPELLDHFTQVNDQDQESVPSEDDHVVSNTIPIPGIGEVHKSTIVSKLNANPCGELSWDRTMRVRSKQQTCNTSHFEDGNEVGLHDDVAVSSKSDQNKWVLG